MKRCTKCGVEKELTEFTHNKLSIGGRHHHCHACRAKTNTDWREKNQGKLKASRRKSKLKAQFGLTPERYNALLTAQKNKCACCNRTFGHGIARPHIDHCHKTGFVRGILCNGCNISEGAL